MQNVPLKKKNSILIPVAIHVRFSLRKGESFEVHKQDPNTYQINMYLHSDEVCDYMCTDGTLWFSTWALITWTLVMIFFWWPINVTPNRCMSLEKEMINWLWSIVSLIIMIIFIHMMYYECKHPKQALKTHIITHPLLMWSQTNLTPAIAYNAQLLHKHLYRNLSIAVIDPFQD